MRFRPRAMSSRMLIRLLRVWTAIRAQLDRKECSSGAVGARGLTSLLRGVAASRYCHCHPRSTRCRRVPPRNSNPQLQQPAAVVTRNRGRHPADRSQSRQLRAACCFRSAWTESDSECFVQAKSPRSLTTTSRCVKKVCAKILEDELARDYLYGAYQQKADLLAEISERGENPQ